LAGFCEFARWQSMQSNLGDLRFEFFKERNASLLMSAVESKCITQGRIKMHHLGRRFSKWILVVVARVKLVMGGESRVFSAGGLLSVPLRGRVWGTVVPQVVGSNSVTYFVV